MELIQLGLQLLQLLPLGAHALVVLAAGRRLAQCGWLPVPGTLPVSPSTGAPLSPPIPHPRCHLSPYSQHLRFLLEGGTKYSAAQFPPTPLSHFRLRAARLQGPSFCGLPSPPLAFQDPSETLKHLWTQSQKSPIYIQPFQHCPSSQQPKGHPTISSFIACHPPTPGHSFPDSHSPKEGPGTGDPTRVLEKEGGGLRGRKGNRVSLA